ncbi:MAG: DUF5667 domain-containing protein [Actinomycetota bacterium]|nr:DUF5667 domain-containing protein [Actinomycetota bacterium]
MRNKRNLNSKSNMKQYEDLLAIVQRLKAIPKAKAGLAFKVKIFFASLFPSIFIPATERRAGEEHRALKRSLPFKIAVSAGISLVLLFAIFGGLTVAARNTKPGDPLYTFKKAGENVSLAFTFNQKNKAKKYLELANVRLSEVQKLIESKEAEHENIELASIDYNSKLKSASEIMGKRDFAGGFELTGEIKNLKTKQSNIERTLASSEPEILLKRASGARIEVVDSKGGTKALCGKTAIEGMADRNGVFEFDIDARNTDPKELLRNLDVVVELDGRKQIAPIAPVSSAFSPQYEATIEPSLEVLPLNTPQDFELQLRRKDGMPVENAQVRISDRTGTSTINGMLGDAYLKTDSSGMCRFEVEKKFARVTSRISLSVLQNGVFHDLGDVLTLGGLETLSEAAGAPPEFNTSKNVIELSNGIISVRIGKIPGQILSKITSLSDGGEAGPLLSPLENSKIFDGPKIIFSGNDQVACQVVFDSSGQRWRYTIILARGEPFVYVKCEGEQESNGMAFKQDFLKLEISPSGEVIIPEGKIPMPRASETISSPFNVAKPFLLAGGEEKVFFACLLNSELYPDSWSITRNSIGVESSASKGTMTLMVGITKGETAGAMAEKASRGALIEDAKLSNMNEGFTVKLNPDSRKLQDKMTRVSIIVYKNYSTVFDNGN